MENAFTTKQQQRRWNGFQAKWNEIQRTAKMCYGFQTNRDGGIFWQHTYSCRVCVCDTRMRIIYSLPKWYSLHLCCFLFVFALFFSVTSHENAQNFPLKSRFNLILAWFVILCFFYCCCCGCCFCFWPTSFLNVFANVSIRVYMCPVLNLRLVIDFQIFRISKLARNVFLLYQSVHTCKYTWAWSGLITQYRQFASPFFIGLQLRPKEKQTKMSVQLNHNDYRFNGIALFHRVFDSERFQCQIFDNGFYVCALWSFWFFALFC